MNEKQPEALRLAAWLNEAAWHQMKLGDVEAAGRELRTQHADIERKDALLRQALGALENSVDDVQQSYDNDWRHGMPTREKQLTSLKEMLDAHKFAVESIRKELQ